MDGLRRPEEMSPEQFEEAQRIFRITEQAAQDERWRMACLLAGKEGGELLGKTEYELREHVHRIGAITLEAAVNERRKKGGTSVAASCAAGSMTANRATTTLSSSTGDPRPS